jgi:shikimate kinase/3-dehydroquinate synthase
VACANPGRGFKAGLAEIAKHALISPSDLLGYLQGARQPIVDRDPDADDQGEAVALGLMAAAYLAFRQGRIPGAVVDQHRQFLAGLGLPVAGEFRLQDLQQAWMRDKKYRHGIRFVVLNAPGHPESGVTADEATLQLVLGDLAKPKSFHRTDPA